MIVCGHLTVDEIHTNDGATRDQIGGGALYLSLAAAAWDVDVTLNAVAAEDFPADGADLIDRGRVTWHPGDRVPGRQRRTHMVYDQAGRRATSSYRDPEFYTATVSQSPMPPPPGLSASLICLCAALPDRLLEWALAARKTGVPVVADTSEFYAQHFPEQFRRLLAEVDYFLPSEVEAHLLCGGNDPVAWGHHLVSLGPRAVVIKLGTQGSLLVDGDSRKAYRIPCAPVQTVDPTGAGDSYVGGFAAGLMLGHDLITCCAMGAATAAQAVTGWATAGLLSARKENLERSSRQIRTLIRP